MPRQRGHCSRLRHPTSSQQEGAIAGVGNGVEIIATNTYVQHRVSTALLGRVFGAIGTPAQVGSSLAYLAGGTLVTGVGPRSAFTLAGLGTIIGLLILPIGTRTRPANL